MGVLSAKAFVAPFLDRKNLIAIVLVAIFFAVYRLSGGTIETSSGNNSKFINQNQKPSFFDQFSNTDSASPVDDLKQLDNSNESEIAKSQASKKPASRDLLKEMLETPKSTNKPSAPSTNRKLDDIEKSLGLR
ncbi:MAG: hypothetical protein SGJ02_14215 [bacterium]|nr:hypothetical protein [bacterium]